MTDIWFLQEKIVELEKENLRLKEDLEIAQKDILDFEEAAKEWKKGYHEIKLKYKIELEEKEQIIEELKQEFKDYKESQDCNED